MNFVSQCFVFSVRAGQGKGLSSARCGVESGGQTWSGRWDSMGWRDTSPVVAFTWLEGVDPGVGLRRSERGSRALGRTALSGATHSFEPWGGGVHYQPRTILGPVVIPCVDPGTLCEVCPLWRLVARIPCPRRTASCAVCEPCWSLGSKPASEPSAPSPFPRPANAFPVPLAEAGF